jgi:phosphoglycolate phosphatase-like HAD superfamily hydrolase
MTMVAVSDIETDVLAACANKRLLVLDYDGTLAYLAVDWSSVRRDLSRSAAAFNFPSDFRPLFGEIGRFRDERGAEELQQLFRVLARHEDIGVDGQQPRPEVIQAVESAVRQSAVNVVVFSVNLHRTIETGLARLRLPYISAIVGADDVSHWKPDPEGLHVLMERAGIDLSGTLFIGDSKRDADAAHTAGIDFLRV